MALILIDSISSAPTPMLRITLVLIGHNTLGCYMHIMLYLIGIEYCVHYINLKNDILHIHYIHDM